MIQRANSARGLTYNCLRYGDALMTAVHRRTGTRTLPH